MNEFTKNMLKTSLVLTIIAGGAALLVGATNALTAPVIEKNNIEKEKKMLSEVYQSEADTFVEWSKSTDEKINKEEHDNGTYLASIQGNLKYVKKGLKSSSLRKLISLSDRSSLQLFRFHR